MAVKYFVVCLFMLETTRDMATKTSRRLLLFKRGTGGAREDYKVIFHKSGLHYQGSARVLGLTGKPRFTWYDLTLMTPPPSPLGDR